MPRALVVALLAVTLSSVGCGADDGGASSSQPKPSVSPLASTTVACALPDDAPAMTPVPVTGFVRRIAIDGDSPWLAMRGGLLVQLDGACRLPVTNVDVGTALYPRREMGEIADFVSVEGGEAGTIWAVVALLDEQSGSPKRTDLVRVNLDTLVVTPLLQLAAIGYSRTSTGLAVSGSHVWVADAERAGSVSRLDPASGSIVATIETQPTSSSQEIAVDGSGRLWTTDDGATLYQTAPGETTRSVIAGEPLPGSAISDIAISDSALWVVTFDQTASWLVALDLADVTHRTVREGLSVRALSKTGDEMWAVTNGPVADLIRLSSPDSAPTRRVPISVNILSTIAANGVVWVVVADGLVYTVPE